MRASPTYRLWLWLAVIAAALLVIRAPARADSFDVDSITVLKSVFFLQLEPGDPPLGPFPFFGYVEVIAFEPGSVFSASVAPPGQDFTALLSDGFGNFSLSANFFTFADLNAALPSGRYFFDLQTATFPTQFSPFLDVFDRFSNTPKLLNSEFYSNVIQLNATQDFTFFWNDFLNFQSGGAQPSAVKFEIVDIFGNIVVQEEADFPATEFTLTAGTFFSNTFYLGRLSFLNRDVSQLDFTLFYGTSAVATEFLISAIDGPPVIQGPLEQSVTVGQLFIYLIGATNHPGSFTVSNLPDGTESDEFYGIIGGFPTQPGVYQLPITATNSLGTGSAIFTLTVSPAAALAITSSTRAAGAKGSPFRFQVLAAGASPAARLSASGLPPGLVADAVSGEISGTPTQAGGFPVTLTVTDGSALASGTLDLSFAEDPAFPNITSPNTATLSLGQTFSYTIQAPVGSTSDPTQFSIIGNLPDGLTFDPATATISGTFTGLSLREPQLDAAVDPHLSGGVVTNVQLFANNSRGTGTIPLVFLMTPIGVANISTRLSVGADPNVLIGGFIITGNAPKKVILRAIAPSLNTNGVPLPGTLSDPTLELVGDNLSATNDDWRATQEQEIIDSTVAPTDDREAALVATLNPGAYTAIVRGKGNQTGIALVEVYDLGTVGLDTSSQAQLANISTRGLVQTGDDVMIGGFIITGASTSVIVRAIGPDLTNRGVPGALQDTTLELRDSSGSLLFANDDWQSDQRQQIIDTTLPPNDPRESALVATLAPGAYTAIVRGKNGATGVGLVEVYVLP